MAHFASRRFWNSYGKLPANIRVLADKNFTLIQNNPQYPSLHFKKTGRFWSARVGLNHRAVGVDVDDGILWIGICTHAEYEMLIRS